MSALSVIAKYLLERAGVSTAERAAERQVPLAVARHEAPLAVRPNPMAVVRPKALPAPPRVLALPKPGPGLPAHAAKPRGGQWWVDKDINFGNYSPEHAARAQLPASVRRAANPNDVALRDWWDKALPRYLKNDFATADDPLRPLADRGLLPPILNHDNVDADTWSRIAKHSFGEDPIEHIMFPPNELGGMPGAGDELRGNTLAAMPWLAKQPVTDMLYQMRPHSIQDLGFDHVGDELRNAMNPEVHGFPPDLAVRPESLGRMSFPQAVEHVGKIGQWREAQLAKQQVEAMNNPAIVLHKEYPDDPRGMRWVELRQPEHDPELDPRAYFEQHGEWPDAPQQHLQDALRFEGDTMGHCVGGYCDDVASGRSRIFSLRDAKGQPHVTIETTPKSMVMSDLVQHLGGDEDRANDILDQAYQTYAGTGTSKSPLAHALDSAGVPRLHDIVQIKGKQNRAPNEDYLPYVQDFVKSQPWGRVGDLHNTDLAALPDGRYITNQQWDEGMRKALQAANPNSDPAAIENMLGTHSPNIMGVTFSDEDWETLLPHFEGFAYGGRVDAHRDFAYHPLTVRRAA